MKSIRRIRNNIYQKDKPKPNLPEKNLGDLEKKIRGEGLFLAVNFINNHPQLVVVNKRPDLNVPLKLMGFYVFSFIIPNSENHTHPTNKGLLYLECFSHTERIKGITDSSLGRINQATLEKNIIKLKK